MMPIMTTEPNNTLEFPSQIKPLGEPMSDFQLVRQTKLILVEALNMVANGNTSRLTAKLIGGIEKVNAICIKNGYPPVDADTKGLREQLKQLECK